MNDDFPVALANLIPINKINVSEKSKLHFTIDDGNGYRTSHNDGTEMCVCVQVESSFAACQNLFPDAHIRVQILAFILASRDNLRKGIDQILLDQRNIVIGIRS